MKKLVIIFITTCISASLLAQPGKDKQKDKSKPEKVDEKIKVNQSDKDKEHNNKVWEGVSGSGSCGIPSKNQPAKVRSSFQRDYPNAGTVTWTKCRGDWTATFNNGIWRSTAVYHANGQRKDTRTPVMQNDVPRSVLGDILKRRPGINIGNIVRIDLPVTSDPLFRVKIGPDTSPEYIFYDPKGVVMSYNY